MTVLFYVACWPLLLFYILFYFVKSVDGEGVYLDVTMPGYIPERDEQYVCVATEVTNAGYIVEFLPSATADRTHHMLAYGCNDPAKPPGEPWDCEHSMMCSSSQKILYAWARNAPPLILPRDVGVPVGKTAGSRYVVLQMHYAKKFGGNVSDYSGVRLRVIQQQPSYLAGISIFLPNGDAIPPNTPTYFMNTSCEYTYNAVVHPFAFRPHTHHLGRVVSAYKYSKDKMWTKIGKGNPQWPQRFYPIDDPVTISKGDILAGQCLYDSTGRDHATYLGSHGHDEMCNFYMYYYVDAKQKSVLNQFQSCSMHEHDELFAQYPPDASTRLPPSPEMDAVGKQGDMSFAVLDAPSWPSADISFGQIAALALDTSNNLVVFHRVDREWGGNTFNETDHFMETDKGPISDNTVIVLSQDGSLVSRWGKAFFYLPHGVFVDENGYLWLTDVAMHQVFKFDMKQAEMKPLIELGKKFEPGSDESHFCKPSAVAVAAGEGMVFIADGYCNNRIMTFGSDGRFIRSWGEASKEMLPGSHSPLGTFYLPHALSLDDSRRRLFVADRENGRVQVFTFDGTPLDQLVTKDFGDTVYGMSFCSAFDTTFVINGPSLTQLLELRVFAFDGSTGRVLYAWTPQAGPLQRPHAVLSSGDCSKVFVGEIGPNKLWRFDIQSTGRRAVVNGNEPSGTNYISPTRAGHKPYMASDVDQTTAAGNGNSVRSEVQATFRLILILFVAIAIPVALVVAICCCVKCRKKDYYRENLLDSGFGRKQNKGGLFANGHRDLKGFQPLSTEDVDASDESDDSDTLYIAQKNYVSKKA